MSKKRKSPAKRKAKKARIAAATAAAKSQGGSSPRQAAQAAADSVPGGRDTAVAVAAATAKQLGVKAAVDGQLSRAEALSAVGLALAAKTGGQSIPTDAGGRKEKAEAAADKQLALFAADETGSVDSLQQRADAAKKELLGDFIGADLTRQGAAEAATNTLLDRLGISPPEKISRREAAETLPRRRAQTI